MLYFVGFQQIGLTLGFQDFALMNNKILKFSIVPEMLLLRTRGLVLVAMGTFQIKYV